MDINSYCDNLIVELTDRKTQINDMVGRLGKLPSGGNKKLLEQVSDLHVIIEEMDDIIGRLRNQCIADWSSEKIELESKMASISNMCEDCRKAISSQYGWSGIIRKLSFIGLLTLSANFLLIFLLAMFDSNHQLTIDVNKYGEMIPELAIFFSIWLVGAWFVVKTIKGRPGCD